MVSPMALPNACFSFVTHHTFPVTNKSKGCCEEVVAADLCWSSDGQTISVGECVPSEKSYLNYDTLTYAPQKGSVVGSNRYHAAFYTGPATETVHGANNYCSSADVRLDSTFLAQFQKTEAWKELPKDYRTVVETFVSGTSEIAVVQSFEVTAKTIEADSIWSDGGKTRINERHFTFDVMKSGAILVSVFSGHYFLSPDGTIDFVYYWGGWDPNSTYVANYGKQLPDTKRLPCTMTQATQHSLTDDQRRILNKTIDAFQAHDALLPPENPSVFRDCAK